MLPVHKNFRIIDAETGESVPAQKLASRSEGSYWAIWAKEVPALGFKCYRIITLEGEANPEMPAEQSSTLLENGYYRLQVDPQTGAIKSWYDKQLGAELADPLCPWQIGQFIYEQLEGDRGTFRGKFNRSTTHTIILSPLANGPIWKSLSVKAEADGLLPDGGFSCEIRLYETEKRLELIYNCRKKPVTDAEAAYIAFPFNLKESRISYEGQGGMVTPGSGQIPRSASDWQAIQNYALVQGNQGQIVWGSNDIPLLQLGEINLGKWMETTEVKAPHLYSWVLNNYWFTNFLAKQEGELCWRYYLSSQPGQDPIAAARFGWGSATALAVRVLAPGPAGTKPASSGLSHLPENVLLVSCKPAWSDNGIVLQLREISGHQVDLPVADLIHIKKSYRAEEVNVWQETVDRVNRTISFKPYEMKMIKITLDPSLTE